MFIPAYVLVWRGNFPEKRVRNEVNGDHYALNTNRMYEITSAYDGNPTMFFFDNPNNVKDGGARMKITDETIASIIAYADSDHGTELALLPIYPNNDHDETPVNTLIPKVDIAYMWAHENSAFNCTWLVYAQGGWDIKKVLVNRTFGDIWQFLNGDPV